MPYYTVYIAYYTDLNLKLCNYTQKQRICRENSKYAPDERFLAIFALAERLPTSATLMKLMMMMMMMMMINCAAAQKTMLRGHKTEAGQCWNAA